LSGGNMPDALVACGQFTICWNLLEYISKVKKDPQNTNPNHQVILDLESVMMEHWKQFQIDPYWMLKELPK
jgi:hypothetical protein